jgi:hypothetical protein
MGKVSMRGDTFSTKKVYNLKTILMDKRLFPNVLSVEVDTSKIGFGYLTISVSNDDRRSRIHWFELASRIMPSYLLDTENELRDFNEKIFIHKKDLVETLTNIYFKKYGNKN